MSGVEILTEHQMHCKACQEAPRGICPRGFQILGELTGMRETPQLELGLVDAAEHGFHFCKGCQKTCEVTETPPPRCSHAVFGRCIG